jgi:hypothetical protein
MNKNFFIYAHDSFRIVSSTKETGARVIEAFKMVKKTDPIEYRRLRVRLKIIFVTRKPGYTNEFFMPEKIWFANQSIVLKNDIPWLASLLVHEGFHATQFRNGKYIVPVGEKMEKPALKAQYKFLSKFENRKENKNAINQVEREKYWEAMYEDKRSFAYFRNLLELYANGKLILKK